MKNVFTGILAKGYAVCRQEHGFHVSTTSSVTGCQGAHCIPQTSYADVLTLSTSAVVVVESLSHAWLFVTSWTATCQASLSFTIFWSLLKLMSIETVMPSNHLILCRIWVHYLKNDKLISELHGSSYRLIAESRILMNSKEEDISEVVCI